MKQILQILQAHGCKILGIDTDFSKCNLAERFGAEIDLILEQGRSRVAVEFKSSSAAKPQRGFWTALKDLSIERAWIIAPIQEGYPLQGVRVASLQEFIEAHENRDFLL